MVFDTRAIASFRDLAGVIGDYSTPGRLETPLTQDQKRDACFMRYQYNWHAHHIAEALGVSVATRASANSAEEDILEALEDCATSDYWNRQQIRLTPGAQISVAGSATYASFRTSAVKDAIARVLIADPKTTTEVLYQKVEASIDQQIANGRYRNTKPNIPKTVNLSNLIRDLEGLGFVWEGSRKRTIMRGLAPDVRILVDAEIIRQCKADFEAGTLNYSAIARNVYSNFVIDEKFGDTMESMGYEAIGSPYVNQLCRQAGIGEPIQTPLGVQIADEENIAAVKKLKEEDPTLTAWQVFNRTGSYGKGISIPAVEGIFKNLGYALLARGMSFTQARDLILKAHREERLTIAQMLEKYPQLDTFYKGKTVGAAKAIQRLLRKEDLTPLTEEGIVAGATEERRTPLVAERLRAGIVGFVHSMESQQSFGRLYLAVPPVQDLAKGLNESESLITEAIQLLLAEPAPIIQMIDGVVQVPGFTQLKIQRGDVSRWEFSAN